MLLIIEALLLISAALLQDSRAAGDFPLNMAEDSVDDQYDGCEEKTWKQLEKDLENKKVINSDYEEAYKNVKKPEDGLKQIHSIAIYLYTNMKSSVYTEFNTAVRSEKQKYKEGSFKWYSLHFFLTDAIKILKKTQNKCYSTFRGTDVEFDKNVKNKEFRFGSYTSSSLEREVAEGFGTKSCFEIKTCAGADVIKYSKYPKQKEVLIPPYEKFKITAVLARKDQKVPWCNTLYVVQSTGKHSYMNCAGNIKDLAKL